MKFPVIKHIDDVLPHIDENFIVAQKDGYTVINYILPCNQTFPEITDTRSAVRRECRGIIFDKDGKLVSRPLEKFFNLNERTETLIENVNLSDDHYIMEKVDGSMVRPFEINNRMIWGTKMGETNMTPMIEEFVNQNTKYIVFAKAMLDIGHTPIFEFVSPKNQIVIDYGKTELILIGIRKMFTGEYLTYKQMEEYADWFKIPLVKVYKSKKLTPEFVAELRKQEGLEGVVVAFENGQRLKVKVDWYVNLHRVKSEISDEKSVVKLILENGIDDIIPLLDAETRIKLELYQDSLVQSFDKIVIDVHNLIHKVETENMSRKDFAVWSENEVQSFVRHIMFKLWDVKRDKETIANSVVRGIVGNCVNNKRFAELRKDVLNEVIPWTGGMFND
jgi:RNA ligase